MTDKQPKALWLADMLEKGFRVDGPDSEAAAELRRLHALCARAMVEPDMAEVERLLHEHEEAVILTDRGADYDPRPEKTRDALFAYVRGILAERDVQIAEREVPIPDLEEEDLLAAYHAGEESGYARGMRDAITLCEGVETLGAENQKWFKERILAALRGKVK